MRFRFFGTEIHIGFLFSVVIALLLVLDKSNTAVFALFAAIMHELAHLCCFLYFGYVPDKVELNALGMRINCSHNTKLSMRQEVIAALAGPGANILLALITVAIPNIEWASRATIINLSIAAFNLLPIFELDGGRAVYYLLCEIGEEKKAQRVVEILSISTLFLLYMLGFLVLFRSGFNFTLIAATVYLTVLTVSKKQM